MHELTTAAMPSGGLHEQPTIHEGVTARALEKKGFISDRCEINREIKADNALLRELKATVKKLMQAVKSTLPAMAEKLETLRQSMIIFRYQLLHIATGRNKMNKRLNVLRPELERYLGLVKQIKDSTALPIPSRMPLRIALFRKLINS